MNWQVDTGALGLLAAALLLAAGGCRYSPGVSPAPGVCVESKGAGLDGQVADLRPGTYTITVVAMTGEAQALADGVGIRRSQGRLWLLPQDSTLRYLPAVSGARDTTAEMPFYGATDVNFAAVGAVDTGDPMSRDPERPGVAVLVQTVADDHEPGAVRTRVTLRIGAKANRRGLHPFDGGYTALRVTRITPGGLAGTWASGAAVIAAKGYFCAIREGD